ncbi:L-rhamnose mutarotase [Bacteroides thetaiotaomicron]|uniref:L-rhamnose mutarotase n=1 Tax=Bacteroides thetaiotaomicron TaxID=818 RepID=UPI001F2DE29F|nr:L-rhamnose mutarotase [Bacteroides thetaiotaomicron]MCF2734611.1 L-rhamnose mutarotase [Bacteroides thetaiotaomicron]
MSSIQGYKMKEFSMPTKRYCQTLSLKNNPILIEEYRKIHSEEKAWPEIRAGILAVGILEMEIYILGSQLFMIIETPLDFDWKIAMDKLSNLPRQAEWEKYVSKFQDCPCLSSSAEKWKLMERMFYLYED